MVVGVDDVPDESKARLKRLKEQYLKDFGGDVSVKAGFSPVTAVDRPVRATLPVLEVMPDGEPQKGLLETPSRVVPVKASGIHGMAIPDQSAEEEIATPEQLQKVCQKWASMVVDRLVSHAMSDDYRAALPAIQILFNRAFGKEGEIKGGDAKLSGLAALPVRERVKALLLARDG